MSQENVELVRAAFQRFQERGIDGVLGLMDESIVVTQPAELPGASPQQHGHAGLREAFRIWPEQWEEYRVEVISVTAAGERVLVTTMQHGRGKGSGIKVEMPFWMLFSIRNAKIVEWQIFTAEAEALKAVGLEE